MIEAYPRESRLAKYQPLDDSVPRVAAAISPRAVLVRPLPPRDCRATGGVG